MPKDSNMQHIDDFIAELDPAELAYLQTACGEALKEEESAEEKLEEEMPMKRSKKPMVPDTADEIPLEEEEE